MKHKNCGGTLKKTELDWKINPQIEPYKCQKCGKLVSKYKEMK